MKELLLSLVISSLTIVAGYVVVKKTDIDLKEMWDYLSYGGFGVWLENTGIPLWVSTTAHFLKVHL